jgi:hypothetical protein
MACGLLDQFSGAECEKRWERSNFIAVHEQFGLRLISHARDEIACAADIEWDQNCAAQTASPKNDGPFGRVSGPKEYAIAFPDAARGEFVRDSVCGLDDLSV